MIKINFYNMIGKKSFTVALWTLILVFGFVLVSNAEWQVPADVPPEVPPYCDEEKNPGCSLPLNVSGDYQEKLGGLQMGGFRSTWHGIFHGDLRMNHWVPLFLNESYSVNAPDSVPPPAGNAGLKRRLTIWVKNCQGSPYGCSSGDDQYGSIGVHYYCDETGQNCFQASQVGARPAMQIVQRISGTHAATVTLTASCPAGHVVSGGGYADIAGGDAGVGSDRPNTSGTAWICTEEGSGDGFECYAVCIPGTATFIPEERGG